MIAIDQGGGNRRPARPTSRIHFRNSSPIFASSAPRFIMADMETKPFRGLYRTVSWSYVTDGTMSFQVPEAEYRQFGHEPDYGKLPWKEDYDAAIATSLRDGD